MLIIAFYGVRLCDRFDTIVDAGAWVIAILRYSTIQIQHGVNILDFQRQLTVRTLEAFSLAAPWFIHGAVCILWILLLWV